MNKSLRIRRDQEDWLQAKHINFTDLVRALLDAYIAQESENRRDPNAPEATAAVSA